jgi:hypothetical protein
MDDASMSAGRSVLRWWARLTCARRGHEAPDQPSPRLIRLDRNAPYEVHNASGQIFVSGPDTTTTMEYLCLRCSRWVPL